MSQRFDPRLSQLTPLLLLICLASPSHGADEPKSAPNLFSNPSFELGRQFWELDKGGKTVATLDINGDTAPSGSQSALIAVGAIDSWGVQFGQNIDGGQEGKTYTFAVLARGEGGPAKVSLQIERRADPYDRAARTDSVSLTEQWTELHVTFKVDKPFSQGWFAYVSCTQPNVKFRVTQFRLYEGDLVPFKEQHRQELTVSGVSIFDTGALSSQPLTHDAITKREGWAQLPEDDTTHAFKGDLVLMNNRLALVLRTGASGAELYSIEPGRLGVLAVENVGRSAKSDVYSAEPKRIALRCVLRPATSDAVQLAGVKVLENNPGGSAVEASFKRADGKLLTMGYAMQMGQAFVQAIPDESTPAVRIAAPCRFAVMPDFFADDMVVDAAGLPTDKADLPSDSFLVNLLEGGHALVMSVWTNRQEDVVATLSGQGADRRIETNDIPCGRKDKVWVSVLSAPGIWHSRDIASADAGKTMKLDWAPPMPAIWRVDWRRADQSFDSWEMILQRKSGDFLKQRIVGGEGTLPADRKRWNTVLGTYAYPCWIENDGRAFLQPLKVNRQKVVRFDGPAVIYPLGRVSATPLDAFTVVDIVRATLGVGPCEYILDLEGQQGQYKGRATCANRDTLNPIYEKGEQKQRKAEVETSLAEVIVFIRHIRSRIEAYGAFGHEVLGYLAEQKKTHPELEKPLGELEALAGVIDQRIAVRREKIKTPDEAAAMIEAFSQDGLDDLSAGAYDKCKRFTMSIVEIGDNQDELAGECRLAVRILRQRAGLLLAGDPRLAEVAHEIRARSQKVLRNPAGHEGAGH